jgi:hypothetical protein
MLIANREYPANGYHANGDSRSDKMRNAELGGNGETYDRAYRRRAAAATYIRLMQRVGIRAGDNPRTPKDEPCMRDIRST